MPALGCWGCRLWVVGHGLLALVLLAKGQQAEQAVWGLGCVPRPPLLTYRFAKRLGIVRKVEFLRFPCPKNGSSVGRSRLFDPIRGSSERELGRQAGTLAPRIRRQSQEFGFLGTLDRKSEKDPHTAPANASRSGRYVEPAHAYLPLLF